MARGRTWLAAVLVAAGLVGVARAEVLEITGEFPARYREASLLHSLSIDRFEGQDGMALARGIERALGGSHFELMGGRAGRNNAEGSLSGGVASGAEEAPFRKKEKQCVERDKDRKCLREEQVEVHCRRRIVTVRADLRLVDNQDGRILYSTQKPFRDETSWCGGDSPSRTVEDTISAAIAEMAQDVRYDLAPNVSTYKIRVREGTKGLSKDAAKRFKDLVKLTKRDPAGACAGWQAMHAEAGEHPSLLFNLGLCAEQSRDYEGALRLYRDAAAAGAGEAREGAERAANLIAGREDAKARARRD